MNDRELDLTEAQKAIKGKYPAINKKYECKWERFLWLILNLDYRKLAQGCQIGSVLSWDFKELCIVDN